MNFDKKKTKTKNIQKLTKFRQKNIDTTKLYIFLSDHFIE